MRSVIITLLIVMLPACATISNNTATQSAKPIPEQDDRSTINQLGKGDSDRMADVEVRENTESLRLLMLKLYKRNPHELQKSTPDVAERMVDWVFNGETQHHYQFESINNQQGTEAIFLAFKPDFTGDRVLAFIVGLQTMLLKAHGNKTDFYLNDSIDPQHMYNVSRNIEIAAWKLSNARDDTGALYLLSNEINDKDKNLSFEREFGKMIGRTDLFAITLAEKSQRLISRVVQSLATAVFLPF
ncbi:hypothetical protein [Methylotenera versatilis]|uniref:Putative lipoprotein n=1 Tax=Methylotenera versatilis (strain 301) TaxID=666681 RepID=D7DMH6_METV0|nr:hypothetical protein [Methylotenera versatilis]ADI28887.1 putative lipoprotein [Methylotenera versatilis 301]